MEADHDADRQQKLFDLQAKRADGQVEIIGAQTKGAEDKTEIAADRKIRLAPFQALVSVAAFREWRHNCRMDSGSNQFISSDCEGVILGGFGSSSVSLAARSTLIGSGNCVRAYTTH